MKDSLPSMGVFHPKSSSIKGCLWSKVIFHRRLWYIKGCLPSKIFFHQRLSSIKDHLPSKVVVHRRRGGANNMVDVFSHIVASMTEFSQKILLWSHLWLAKKDLNICHFITNWPKYRLFFSISLCTCCVYDRIFPGKVFKAHVRTMLQPQPIELSLIARLS